MRKYFIVVLSFIMVISILAACSSSDNGGNINSSTSTNTNEQSESNNIEGTTQDAEPENVAISIYYPTPDRPEDRALEDDKIRRFTEEYPHVEIIKSDWQYDPNQIGIKMGANEAPTLFNTYATEGAFLVERGWAADITDLYNNYADKDQMNPVLQEQFNIDGKVYGIAQRGYVVGTVVNKKMLDESGVTIPSYDWTWDDMYDTAVAAAKQDAGIAGIAPMGIGNEAGWNWTNFLFLAGGDIQDVSDGKVTTTFNSDAGIKALEFYHKLRWEGNVIPQDWALGWGDAVGAFAQGRTAMVIAGADGPVDQALNQGGFTPEDILVYPMPAYEKGGKHTGVLGGDYLVINPNASKAEQEMAFKYATFDYFSDKGLESIEASIQQRKTDGAYFIPPVVEIHLPESEYGLKVKAVYDKYDNVYQYDPEIMKLLDGKPEAQYETQEFYAAMTNVIQEIFSNENADFKAQIDAAAQMVQETYYDGIEVQ